ncbi:unnamed protein product [Candidula unifasciata]|uniref:Haloacid dehalogenase-like hydrolase domain-containing protein 3 n=1 Tax=Candidula unifasciata TaxID=100452 RepID=A0A8S3YEY7_9EUPU|nr:unnamed protein product [Candidula unifasciata]
MHFSRMMGGSAIKLVTLDVTNTLIRVVRSPGYQYAYIGLKHGLELDDRVLTGLFFKYYKEYSRKYPNFGVQCMISPHTWWTALVKDCFRSADARIPEETLNLLADDLYFHYTTAKPWELFPGAVEAIKDLRQYAVKIGVISNWDHRLYKVLEAMKLRPYFDFVLTSTVACVEKPDSAIFHLALQNAGCRPDEAVHFGDNVEKDFHGAHNAGMRAYLLVPSGVQNLSVSPNLVVNSVQEFVDVIRPQLGAKADHTVLEKKEIV